MFTAEQLTKCLNETWFIEGFRSLERSLLCARLGIAFDTSLPWRSELSRFSKAVLASIPGWTPSWIPLERENPLSKLSAIAADIEAALGILSSKEGDDRLKRQHILCASILYDLAGLMGTAASQIEQDGFSPEIRNYFTRRSAWWGPLLVEEPNGSLNLPDQNTLKQLSFDKVVNEAIAEILEDFGHYIQRTGTELPKSSSNALQTLIEISSNYDIGLDGDVLAALHASIEMRWANSTLRVLSGNSYLHEKILKLIGAPAELWPVQRVAIDSGLLRDQLLSFGLAAPTGTGKTALTLLLLTEFFEKHPGLKAIYVSPSRALTSQIAKGLSASLSPLGIAVAALGASLTIEDHMVRDASVADLLVFTPEKADLLLRVAPELIEKTGLVIVDEAHHIEQGTRGIILEFYLWRLRSLIPASARIVQLSAVTPNIHELVEWLGDRESSVAVKLDWRSSRLRLGIFEYTHGEGGTVQFEDAESYQLFQPGECSSNNEEMVAQVAQRLSRNGIVLVLCMSPTRAERLAELIADLREEPQSQSDAVSERLDARIERELFPTSPLRTIYSKRVVFHHAQLPPRIRIAVEQAISGKHVDIVCATTTLAEGVNFPFSTVLVESLVGKNYELTPRSLWNIAGRAGRFGVDLEGHCILFRPSRWKYRLKRYKLEDYISIKLDDIPPVKSALAAGLSELKGAVDESEVDMGSLEKIDLDEIKINGKATDKAKRIRGLVNVMRVGYAHASVSGTMSLSDSSATEFSSGLLLAAKQIPEEVKEFATAIGGQQRKVISDALHNDAELLRIAARVGWSLESQSSLFEWVKNRQDWQLEQYGNLVRGGYIYDFDKLGYLIGPLAKMMSEFEGEKLGGFTSYIAVGWLQGLPLITIRDSQRSEQGRQRMDFGRLVHTIYARIQYLLPWALFGLNELIQYEAKRRGISVSSGVGDMSVFASEGVPSFDALHLVLQFDIERVDATRLAATYKRNRYGMDIVSWLRSQDWQRVVAIVRGLDRRRLDPDLRKVWEALRQSA